MNEKKSNISGTILVIEIEKYGNKHQVREIVIFSHMHMTLQLAMLVHRSIGLSVPVSVFWNLRAVFVSLLLTKYLG